MLKLSFPGSPLLATLLLLLSASIAEAQAPDRPHSDLERGVDATIRPGEDFFGFANGEWLRTTEIPAGKERWNARNEIGELTREQLSSLLDATGAQPPGSLGRKVADFRAAYLNEAAIEARGIAPLRSSLDSIDQVSDRAALTGLLGRGVRADVDPLNWGIYRSSGVLGLAVEPSIHGEKTNVAFLLQGGLGLPDREYYLGTKPSMQALRAAYQRHVARLLDLAGIDRAAERAAGVMALETALARAQTTSEASANDRNADNRWSQADFARCAPGMNWSSFFAAAGLSREEAIVAWQPGAVIGLAALVGSRPLEQWKDYLRVRLIDEFADVLPAAFVESSLAMRGAVAGQAAAIPRGQRAIDATQAAMRDAIGTMYADRYFPAEQKARLETIVANVIAAFRKRVEVAPWMSAETRAVALARLKTVYFGVGYPEQGQDYSDLTVDPADPVGNLRRAADRNFRRTLARLGRPVDLTEWWIAPQTVAAVLVFQQNAYNFPAALLQAPKFDPTASDATNYGAIGAIVGHEISHFVDLLGAEWDSENRMRRWWTAEDVARFQRAADALGNQVAGYQPLPGLTIDPKLTQTENVADLAGLAAAFDAYRATLGNRTSDTAFVRQQDREFFIGFARSWRGKIREEAMPQVLKTDHHAPEPYRIALVRNLDAWYAAFDVQPGQRLYLKSEDRVRVW